MYKPNDWVIIRVDSAKQGTYFKVLGIWYPTSDMPWRLNSGITKIIDCGEHYEVHGYSGSIYECMKDSEGVPEYMQTLIMGLDRQGGKVVPVQECIEYLQNL